MAEKLKKTKKAETTETKGDRKIHIPSAKQFENGGVAFTVCVNEVTIYNCWLNERKNDGQLFISFPSYKGKDGKYYSYAYTKFTDSEFDEIVKQINELI